MHLDKKHCLELQLLSNYLVICLLARSTESLKPIDTRHKSITSALEPVPVLVSKA
jgi:hypothetical protein